MIMRYTNLLVMLMCMGFSPCVQAYQKDVSRPLDETGTVVLSRSKGPYLLVKVQKASELTPTLQMFTGHFSDKGFSVEELGIKKLEKRRATIPFLSLSPGFKRLFIQTLWPKDRMKGGYLVHKAVYPQETFWTVSQLYTGYGKNYEQIKKASKIRNEHLEVGMTLKIPEALLLDFLQLKKEKPVEAPPLQAAEVTPDEEAPTVSAPVVEDVEETPSAPADETPIAENADRTPPADEGLTNDPSERYEVGTKSSIPRSNSQEPRSNSQEPRPSNEQEPKAYDGTIYTNPDLPVAEEDGQPEDGEAPAEGRDEQDPSEEEFVAVDPKAEAEEEEEQDAEPAQAGVIPEGIRDQLRELEEARRELRYGEDVGGKYAEYRLKKGEAIYSAVVVRFCGLIRAKEVNALADVIIARNGIHDVTDMKIGTAIRIPYDALEAEFRDQNDRDYKAFIRNLKEVSQVATFSESRNLDGVTVILDAGHGGKDPGADRKRVWEDDYVYDILCRAKKRLESQSSAKVHATILDPSDKYKVQDITTFKRDQDEVLLTQPKYPLTDKKATSKGVNLRWKIANDHLDELVGRGTDPGNVLFASFHADALHKSIRGAMVYVPDARHQPNKSIEAKRGGKGKTSSRAKLQEAQGRSTQFASLFIKASQERNIKTHSQKPIRTLIYRNPTRPYVPAVLKYNRVPTRVLIEVCNLNNPEDQDLLKDPDFRQRVADAFVVAVMRSYGNNARAALEPDVHSVPAD